MITDNNHLQKSLIVSLKKIILLSVISSSLSLAETESNDEANEQALAPVDEIVIVGVRKRLEQAGTLLNIIQKTEIIGAGNIEAQHAANLTEAIALSPGVRVSNDCSMCGVKRIMLNGLKGEHTTILTDGMPVHTMISGYYAVDAVAITGIDRIEVARGAGASLIAPEAMGGTINIVTMEATETGGTIDTSTGENGFTQVGLLGTFISADDSTRLTVIGQFDTRDQFDADANGVSENPFLENKSLTASLSHDLGYADNITLRVSKIYSEVFGGPVLGGATSSIRQALDSYSNGRAPQLFVDNNVSNRFIGEPWETTEWVATERDEISLSWLHEINERWNMTLSTSYANHIQDSFYEGFDYYGDDVMHYYDARFNFYLSSNHILTFGGGYRSDVLDSFTQAGSNSSSYISDSFDYQVSGFYVQDTWTPGDAIEVALAMRVDNAEADFTDPLKPGIEIEETVVSPRMDARLFHNDLWTSRFSAGRGYRAPLSFFETDHGILDGDAGFAIEIDSLERSKNASYALSYEGDRLTSTLSLAWTQVQNLAGVSETPTGVPLLTQDASKSSVTSADLAIGFQASNELLLNFIVENFQYDEEFKSTYAIAPIEQRLSFSFDYDYKGWGIFLSAAWIGARDLSDYGYSGSSTLSSSESKPLHSPTYWTADMRIAKEFSDSLSAYIGANNLLDYTQAGDEDSPLAFRTTGSSGINESYDVAYIYGPLRGREIYAGLKWIF